MKLFTEYLNNKIKDAKYLGDGFPTKPNYNEILDFLKSQGFKLLNYNVRNSYLCDVIEYVIEHAETSDAPLVIITDETFASTEGKRHTWIRICNCGDISKDNPIFLLRLFKDDDSSLPDSYEKMGVGTIEIDDANRTEIETYDEFVELVNKQFGWK